MSPSWDLVPTSADKYVLEDVFMEDSNKLFLKLWRMANYTEMPSSKHKGGLVIASASQPARVSPRLTSSPSQWRWTLPSKTS